MTWPGKRGGIGREVVPAAQRVLERVSRLYGFGLERDELPWAATTNQYLALRPIRRMPGVPSPLAGEAEIDIVVVRENVEGEYSERGVVSAPDSLYVIVASNLFGDILSDLTAAIAGSIGIAPNANHTADLGGGATTETVTQALESALGQ